MPFRIHPNRGYHVILRNAGHETKEEKLTMRRIPAAAAIVVWCCLGICPQSASQEKVGPTKHQQPEHIPSVSISGRVFLITEAGDLKPARLANVYLLNEPVTEVFLKKYNEESQSRTAAVASGNSTGETENTFCLGTLLTVTNSLDTAAESAKGKRPLQILGTQTDEYGMFQIRGIVLGPKTKKRWDFEIIAKGRAGETEAYWESDIAFFQVSGQTAWSVGAGELQKGGIASIEMSSPETSCFVHSQ